jgi:ribosomal-protein-alanine N-acetyltransferase
MTVSTNGIELRLWQPGDEDALVRLADNRRIWRNLTNRFPHPYRREDAIDWIDIANQKPDDARHFAVLLDGVLAGSVGFQRLGDLSTRTAEIGYWIGEPFQGRGIATEALRRATAQAFAEFDFVRLQAGVLAWNPASGRVLEKAGYALEARLQKQVYKDGEVCDLLLYVLLRDG